MGDGVKRLMVVNLVIIGDFGLLVNRMKRYNSPMFVLASHFATLPVISLQTGETIAVVKGLIIDMSKLKVVGLTVSAGKSPRTLLIMASVRQLASDCVIVNDEDELSEPDDVIRFQPLLKTMYTPLGSQVYSEGGHHLGSVEEFTVSITTEEIQRIYVKPPLIRSFFSSSLIIDRTQVIDVQPSKLVVKETLQHVPKLSVDKTATESS
jgi:sporulation protein YlmC with PRC-barrel domain